MLITPKTYISIMRQTQQLKIHPKMIVGLQGIIQGGMSVKDFSAVTKISDVESKIILDEFIKNDIGTKEDNSYLFEDGDKLKIAISLLEKGYPIDEISVALEWRDFEGLTGEILSEKNFAVMKNMMLTKPRMEIDVVGIRLGIAILIDCKHWKRYSSSALSTAVKKQIERTKQYVAKTPGAIAVPVIVTLYQDKINFIENVPIVPIFQFASFVDEFYGNIDQMNTIGTD
jgi:DNA-binding transcriptional MerR regulator